MRRSKSSSQIPVKLFGGSNSGISVNPSYATKSRNSTNATNRPHSSHIDIPNVLKPRRNSSLDRKSTLSVKQTPLTRQRSFQRTTPASVRSNCSSKVSPAVGLKERPTIQKLCADKSWVATQYSKVQNFIMSDLFDPTIVTPNNIKPPSINVFIYIVSVLMKQLFGKVKITNENYKEEIPRKLKAMFYPGNMTTSTLKTVNTMHSWPQVIGMFGWLIDKVNLINRGPNDYSDVPEEERYKYALPQLCIDYVMQKYIYYNSEQCQSEELDEQFVTNFAEILGVSKDQYEQINAECEEHKQVNDALLRDVNELTKKRQILEQENQKLMETLEDLERRDADEDAALEAEIEYYTTSLNKLSEKESKTIASITNLEESMKVQSCTYQEKRNLLETIKTLKNEINIYKEKIRHAQDVKDEFDVKIDEEREKLQSKVTSWNRSLYEICIKKPNYKCLLLKETALYRNEFIDEIREMSKKKTEIENELREKIQSIEMDLNQCIIDIQNMSKNLRNLQRDTNKLEIETKQLCEQAAVLEKDSKQKLFEWEQDKQLIITEMTNSEEMQQLNLLTNENQELVQIRQTLRDDLEKFKITSVNFFIELDKQVEHNILEMKRIVEGIKNQIEEAVKENVEEKNRFITLLEHLKIETE